MKIIIADDEEKICQLIIHLIDWKALEMEIAAVVHNGLEVLDAITEYKPDIIITDIRMPGLDGLEMIRRARELDNHLEFIIISGYRHFEYAQSAIRYGVKDYLLKPIKKNELYNVLERMRQAYRLEHDHVTQEEKYRELIKHSLDKLRAAFFTDVLFKNDELVRELTLDEINERYHYKFMAGSFQVVSIKVDSTAFGVKENLAFMQKKILTLLGRKLCDICIDREYMLNDSWCYILLNYLPGKELQIRKIFKSFISELLLQKDIFETLRVTVGLGTVENQVDGLWRSKSAAIWAVEQRLVSGGNRVIEGILDYRGELDRSRLFGEFSKIFSEGLGSFSREKTMEAIIILKEGIKERADTSGHEILQVAKEVVNLYLLTMKRLELSPALIEGGFEEFDAMLDNLGSTDEVFDYLGDVIGLSFNAALKQRKEEGIKPIRETCQYINKHMGEPVTLEVVSGIAGFNPTYFSTLFKKETGKTFLEYLTKARMDKAKELLRETNDTIASICVAVGYSDTKYFVKSFQKYTGLKPNEYRKIYS